MPNPSTQQGLLEALAELEVPGVNPPEVVLQAILWLSDGWEHAVVSEAWLKDYVKAVKRVLVDYMVQRIEYFELNIDEEAIFQNDDLSVAFKLIIHNAYFKSVRNVQVSLAVLRDAYKYRFSKMAILGFDKSVAALLDTVDAQEGQEYRQENRCFRHR